LSLVWIPIHGWIEWTYLTLCHYLLVCWVI